MADAVVVRPSCPECGSRHVPARRTNVVDGGRMYIVLRRCSECGRRFKTVEVVQSWPSSPIVGPNPYDTATTEGNLE